MQVKSINKEIALLDGIRITIDIDILLSDTAIIREEDSFIDDMLVNQVLNGLKDSIERYKESEMPNKFIKNQRYIITNKLPSNIKGVFSSIRDEIYVDADVISGITNLGAAFLHGHEVGHKIEKYFNLLAVYEEIAHILDLSVSGNEYLISETFADECGNITAQSNIDHGLLRYPLEQEKREYIHRKILYNLYKG